MDTQPGPGPLPPDGAGGGGRVSLVGAGPGDPGLLTLLGARRLAEATAVLTDDLVSGTIRELIPQTATVLYVGKRAGRASMPQEEIQEEMIRLAKLGHRVVRLKGGDPLVFGRGLEELRACEEAGVPADLVPGISSALAAPAYAGLSPSLRGVASAFTIVTGHEDPEKGKSDLDWDALARTPGTLVILMGMGRLRQIVAALLMGGRPGGTPAAVIQWGTTGGQRELFSTLAALPGAVEQDGISSPAVIVIGEVAAETNRVDWLSRARPLLDLRVADTRPGRLSVELRDRAMSLGAQVSSRPLIRTEALVGPNDGLWPVADLVGTAGDWLVFSSAAGVRLWAGALRNQHLDGRTLAGRHLACVGKTTADALREEMGLAADLIAQPSRQEGLLAGLVKQASGAGHRALLLGAETIHPGLEQELSERGWTVCRTVLYRTHGDREGARLLAEDIKHGRVDAVVFSSGSAVDALAAVWGEVPQPPELTPPAGQEIGGFHEFFAGIITIGPVTSNRVKESGWLLGAEADEPTARGLCDALVRWHRTTQGSG